MDYLHKIKQYLESQDITYYPITKKDNYKKIYDILYDNKDLNKDEQNIELIIYYCIKLSCTGCTKQMMNLIDNTINNKSIKESNKGQLYCMKGDCYRVGIKLQQNYDKAIELYKLGIKCYNTASMFALAYMYLRGLGIKKDYMKAIELYKETIKYNNPQGYYNMGYLYYEGIYFKQDINEAINYFKKGIKYNHSKSIHRLALIYEQDIKDINEACKYYSMYFSNNSLSPDKLIRLINNNKSIIWKSYLHKYWHTDKTLLDDTILLLLLISRYRRQSNIDKLQSVMIKGITMKVIKYVCHQYIDSIHLR
jgi:tetratricopeptide (TPR) repeat protein